MRKAAAQEESSAGRRFLGVREVAALLGVDTMTVYRAIAAREFPVIKIRGRYVIPSRVIDELEEAAVTSGSMIDPACWNPERESA